MRWVARDEKWEFFMAAIGRDLHTGFLNDYAQQKFKISSLKENDGELWFASHILDNEKRTAKENFEFIPRSDTFSIFYISVHRFFI